MTTKLQNGIDPTAHANGAQPAVVSGQIYAAIHAGHLAVNKLTAARANATTAIDTGKVATYTKLAKLAYDGDWSNDAIEEQIKVLRAKDNTKGKNYFSEVSKVMQENVRFHVPAFFKLAKDAFAADSDTMNAAHKRQLHYVLNYLIPEAVAGVTDPTRVPPANVAEAIATAKVRLKDVDLQVAADLETVKRASKALNELHKRYETAGLGAIATTLAAITAGALTLARKKSEVDQQQANAQLEALATARAQRDKPTKLPVEQPATTPLPGAIDIEALMAGMANMQQQIAALVAVAPKPRARK